MAERSFRNAAELLGSGAKGRTPREILRDNLKRRLSRMKEEGYDQEAALQRLFPNTVLDPGVLRSITTAILAGNHTLLFGPPGSGKTNLAKDVWNLFPRTVYTVDGCPVQDDPFSVVDAAYSKAVPPCPFCKVRYWSAGEGEADGDDRAGKGGGFFGRAKKDEGKGATPFSPGERTIAGIVPEQVPVRQITLREGYGFARIQGSPEVFPDNLTGTINLHRLEELGDPTSPLVLEPGKLLQANRGLLIIDEIGKLPLGTQNVLLQALQESAVSPAKSRETFPASFIAVATSNLDDLDNINEPLNDRLTNLHVGFNSDHGRNRLIIEMALARADPGVFVPSALIDASAFLTEAWRRGAGHIHEFAEVGSNRTMIDLVTRACAHTHLSGGGRLGLDHYRRGVYDAMMGRIRVRGGDSFVHNRSAVEKFIDNHLDAELSRAGMLYWCAFFRDELRGNRSAAQSLVEEIGAFVRAGRSADGGDNDASGEYERLSSSRNFRSFAKYALRNEKYRAGLADWEVVAASFSLLQELDVFECPKSGVEP